jgi:hypothetical protein
MRRGEGQRETDKATGTLVPFHRIVVQIGSLRIAVYSPEKRERKGDIDASGGEWRILPQQPFMQRAMMAAWRRSRRSPESS